MFLKTSYIILKISQVWELLGCNIWSQSKRELELSKHMLQMNRQLLITPLLALNQK